MSRSQRLAFLAVAAVIAVIAVVVLSSGGDDEPASTTRASGTATPSATQEAGGSSATSTPEAKPPVLHSGQVAKLQFKQGDTVRFSVRSDTPEEVHVHGYDIKKDIEPGKPVEFSFKATITGIFEVEFEDSAEQIAQLRVDPK